MFSGFFQSLLVKTLKTLISIVCGERVEKRKKVVAVAVVAIVVVALFAVIFTLKTSRDPLSFSNVKFSENPKAINFTITNTGETTSTISRIKIDDVVVAEPNTVLAVGKSVNYSIPYAWIWGWAYLIRVYSSTGEVFYYITAPPQDGSPEPPNGALVLVSFEWSSVITGNETWVYAIIAVRGNASIYNVTVNGELVPTQLSAYTPDGERFISTYGSGFRWVIGNNYFFVVSYNGGKIELIETYGGV